MKRQSIQIVPIGVIHSPFKDPEGTPIQPSSSHNTPGTVELLPEFVEGLHDLEGFERIWLIYWFHRSRAPKLRVVPFRDMEEHGVFATRAPSRPNNIGISAVTLIRIDGNILHVAGIDVVDGTPLLDIKPYVPEFDAYECVRIGWLGTSCTARDRADARFGPPDKPENNKEIPKATRKHKSGAKR